MLYIDRNNFNLEVSRGDTVYFDVCVALNGLTAYIVAGADLTYNTTGNSSFPGIDYSNAVDPIWWANGDTLYLEIQPPDSDTPVLKLLAELGGFTTVQAGSTTLTNPIQLNRIQEINGVYYAIWRIWIPTEIMRGTAFTAGTRYVWGFTLYHNPASTALASYPDVSVTDKPLSAFPAFDQTQDYKVGDFVTYGTPTTLYYFVNPHHANDPWDAQEVINVSDLDVGKVLTPFRVGALSSFTVGRVATFD